jgi:hypothetical protein
MVTLNKFRPIITWLRLWSGPRCSWGTWVRASCMKKKVIFKQRTLNSHHRHYKRADTKTNWPTVSRNITWTCVIALQIIDPSYRQRGRPAWRRKKVTVTQINVNSGHLLQKGPDTKTNWPSDRQSQYKLDLIMWDFKWQEDIARFKIENK